MPRLVAGEDQVAFGFTEPDAGLNTTRIKTFARKVDGGYVVNGQKVWTSTAQVANKLMLLARTTRYEDCARPTDGITIFYTDLDRSKIEVHRIPKMGRKAVEFERHLHRRPVHSGFGPDRRGGQGLLLYPAQPQSRADPDRGRSDRYRPGRAAPGCEICQGARGVRSPDRTKPGDPASACRELDVSQSGLANGDAGGRGCTTTTSPVAQRPTAPNFSAPGPATTPAWQSIMTHGGFGYAREYHVERLFREVSITRLAPITEQLILVFIAEKVLDLPKSY